MEEKLGGCQASKVRVLHETTRLRAVVVLDEVRQGAVAEAERDSLTLNVLLPHTGNDLRK